MRGILLGAVALVAAAPVSAQDWRMLLYNEVDAGRVAVYFDAASIKKPTPTTREITVANVFEKTQQLSANMPYQMIQTNFRIDCTAMTGNSTGTAAHDAKGVVLTSGTQGKTTVMLGGPYSKAAKAACTDDLSGVKVRAEGPLLQDGLLRFRLFNLLNASLNSTSWHRISYGGPAGKQIAIFVDKSSITTDAQGRRLVATMTVEESPVVEDSSKRFHYATRVDCAANHRNHLYAQVYSPSGKLRGPVVTALEPSPMTPGMLNGGFQSVCTGNWSTGRAFPMLPQAIVASAFTR
jgi:hypothetical protein